MGLQYQPFAHPHKKAAVIGLYLSGKKKLQIAKELELDRETVVRILSQEETKLLVSGYRDAVLRIVPKALVGARELVDRLHPQTIANVLYGSRVLIDRHEVGRLIKPSEERDYSSSKVEYYAKYHRWPSEKQAREFDRTIKRLPLVKGAFEVK